MRLVFELELFEPTIGILGFGWETRITRPIAPKIFTKKNLYVPHVSSKIQVSTFSRFKVIEFLIFVAEFVFFLWKNMGTFDAKSQLSKNERGLKMDLLSVCNIIFW